MSNLFLFRSNTPAGDAAATPSVRKWMQQKFHRLLLPSVLGWLGLALLFSACMLSACSGAPVQEMSDARQAIQAARDAGVAETPHNEMLSEAQKLLKEAKRELELGDYSRARDIALSAKEKALMAKQLMQDRE